MKTDHRRIDYATLFESYYNDAFRQVHAELHREAMRKEPGKSRLWHFLRSRRGTSILFLIGLCSGSAVFLNYMVDHSRIVGAISHQIPLIITLEMGTGMVIIIAVGILSSFSQKAESRWQRVAERIWEM